jgi:PAS domain S-box-containing protein
MLTVVTDISDRKAMEQALRESEQRFRAVVDVQGEFIIRQRPDGMLTFVNDAFCRFRGMTREQMLGGYNDLAALPAPAQDEVLRQWARLSPERPSASYDIALEEADGSVRWEQWSDTAIFDAGRRLVEYQSVGRDVTEQKVAGAALRESEERLRTIAEGVPLPVTIARTDVPEILFANARAIEAFGLTIGPQPEVIARTWVRAIDRVVLLERLAISGRVDNYEVELRRVDGSTLWALVSARAMSFDGKPAMFTAIADISEQKAMEEALRASEARLAAFMDHAPVGMYVKDREGRYVVANPEMAKVFGRPVAEMLGRTAADSPATHDMGVITRSDAEVLETGRGLVVEEYTPDLDAYRWDMVIRFPIRDAHGQITHIGGFDVDIAERKRAEQQLRESEQRFRVLAEVHPVPLVIVGVENATIIFASPACAAMFDVPLSRLIGQSILSFYHDPADRQVIMARVLREGGLKDYEVMMRRGDGTPFWTAFTSKLITFEGKEAVVAAYTDLTEKKRAEAELERQREALLHNEKMSALGSLLTSVAHELNNPLSVVVGQATMLEELSGGSAEAVRAAKIRAAADRCARIVKTFLAMARSKAPERREVQVNEVIRAALEIAAYGLNSTGAQIELQLAPDLPPLWADADQLHQVFTNLIINAKQAMQSAPGSRRLTIRTRADAERDAVMIEVEDTGPGIAPELGERIFEPFFTTKPQGVGTGIGLSVSKRIVAAHGGEIGVSAAPAGGACFRIRLPRAQQPPAAGAEDAPHLAAPAANARVLVVDDEPEIGEVLAEILRLDGFLVDVATGGRRAIERLGQIAYDLVISDLRMPDLDGPALYRELERNWPHLTRRILFVTGDTLSVDTSEFIAASGAPVIEKPFDAQRIRQLAAEQVALIRRPAKPADRPA